MVSVLDMKKQNPIFDKYYKVVGKISNFLILFVLYIKKSPSRFYRDADMLEIKMESVTSYIQVQVLQTGIGIGIDILYGDCQQFH
jgi:hypothetical protein